MKLYEKLAVPANFVLPENVPLANDYTMLQKRRSWWNQKNQEVAQDTHPADFTNLLTSGATSTKNVWFLNFTFPSPIVDFTRYIRFWRLVGEMNICAWKLFCTKSNSEQVLFEAFFDMLLIFGITEPQNKSNFTFLYIKRF